MRTRLPFLAILTLGFVTATGLAAPGKPSRISAFAGKFPTGTSTFSLSGGGSGSSAAGTSSGTFSTSKKKETGLLTVTSSFTESGITVVFTQTFQFVNRALFFTITQSGNGSSTSVTGSGSASISKKTINFSGTYSTSGLTVPVSGSVRLTKTGIVVNDMLSPSGTSLTFTNTLKAKKK